MNIYVSDIFLLIKAIFLGSVFLLLGLAKEVEQALVMTICLVLNIKRALEGYFVMVALFLLSAGGCVKYNAMFSNNKIITNEMENIIMSGNVQEVKKRLADNSVNLNDVNSEGASMMHIAAQVGQASMVSFFVEKDKSLLEKRTLSGWRPLHMAADRGHLEVVKVLLNKGADVNAFDSSGRTPLYKASQKGHEQVVSFLLKEKASVDVICNGWHPLHVAAYGGHLEVVKVLLSKGADVNAFDSSGQTPLYKAAQNGHEKVVFFLLKKKASVDDTLNGWRPLHVAADRGHLEIVRAFLDKGAEVNAADKNRQMPLHVAADRGHLEIVRAFLDKDADVNATDNNGQAPLHVVADRGHLEVVKVLVNKGAEVNAMDKNNQTPLHLASNKGHLEVVKVLVEKGANVNFRGKNDRALLHILASRGDIEIVKILVENGVDVNAVDKDGQTPLYNAAQNGYDKLVSFLLDHKAEANVKCRGSYPLHIAAYIGHLDVVKALVRNGVDVNVEDINGQTPLHRAAQKGHDKVVSFLLDQKDKRGRTLTHILANKGDVEGVKFLVKKGADVNVEDINGQTPLHRAAQKGHDEVVAFLLEKKAAVDGRSTSNSVPPLYLAAVKEKKSTCILLIKKGASLNRALATAGNLKKPDVVKFIVGLSADSSPYPLHTAVDRETEGKIEALLRNDKFQINEKDTLGETPIFLAIRGERKGVVKLMLEYGADLNVQNIKGLTPIHMAVENRDLDMLGLLLEESQPNLDLDVGRAGIPLYFAAKYQFDEIAKFLFEKGSNILAAYSEAFSQEDEETKNYLLRLCGYYNENNEQNDNVIHRAVKGGKLNLVELYIAKGDINAISDDQFKETPLFVAAKCGLNNMVSMLLESGADPNITDGNKKTPLWIASQNNKETIVELLVERGADIDQADDDRVSPLYAAGISENVEIVNLLKVKGADVVKALKFAKKNNFLHKLKWILSKEEAKERLYSSIKERGVEDTEFLISEVASLYGIEIDNTRAWAIAKERGNSAITKVLSKYGIVGSDCMNEGEETASSGIYSGEKPTLLVSMIDKEEKKMAESTSALNKTKERVPYTSSIHDSDIDDEWDSSNLVSDDKSGQSSERSSWTTEGVVTSSSSESLSSSDDEGDTMSDSTEEVESVDNEERSDLMSDRKSTDQELEEGHSTVTSDTKEANGNQFISLHSAAYDGHLKLVKALVEKGADVNVMDEDGRTPLYMASNNGHKEVVVALLHNGANINIATKNSGMTPLMLASMCGHKSIVEELIKSGANVNQMTKDGKENAISFAYSRKQHHIVKLLLDHQHNKKVENYAEGKGEAINTNEVAQAVEKEDEEKIYDLVLNNKDVSVKDIDKMYSTTFTKNMLAYNNRQARESVIRKSKTYKDGNGIEVTKKKLAAIAVRAASIKIKNVITDISPSPGQSAFLDIGKELIVSPESSLEEIVKGVNKEYRINIAGALCIDDTESHFKSIELAHEILSCLQREKKAITSISDKKNSVNESVKSISDQLDFRETFFSVSEGSLNEDRSLVQLLRDNLPHSNLTGEANEIKKMSENREELSRKLKRLENPVESLLEDFYDWKREIFYKLLKGYISSIFFIYESMAFGDKEVMVSIEKDSDKLLENHNMVRNTLREAMNMISSSSDRAGGQYRYILELYGYGGVDEMKSLSEEVAELSTERLKNEIADLDITSIQKLVGVMTIEMFKKISQMPRGTMSSTSFMLSSLVEMDPRDDMLKKEPKEKNEEGAMVNLVETICDSRWEDLDIRRASRYMSQVHLGAKIFKETFEAKGAQLDD